MNLTKRHKIITASTLITIGLLSTQFVNIFHVSYRLFLPLGILAYLLSLWALWENMSKLKAVVLMILPVMFTVAVASFYFLLPIRWLTRFPVIILFFLSFYSLLLSQNVFNVAAQRTIPLYRAASTVGFLFTLITAFFLFNVTFALKMPFYINALVVFIISFPLNLQLLWSVEMEKVDTTILVYSLILSCLVGEVALALSFWPVAPTIWSLSLSAIIYVTLGVVTEYMRDRLTRKITWEYIGIGGLVLLFSMLVTSWGA
ncbi:hypothetical protein HYW46_07065 [Candidatus Daviesbacteria bacterium]|nr:hypothetical protein [Candidatus Daviesbacteria bacterium]